MWGCSSAGRAPALQAGGHRFEPVHLHQVDFEEIDKQEADFVKQNRREHIVFRRKTVARRANGPFSEKTDVSKRQPEAEAEGSKEQLRS